MRTNEQIWSLERINNGLLDFSDDIVEAADIIPRGGDRFRIDEVRGDTQFVLVKLNEKRLGLLGFYKKNSDKAKDQQFLTSHFGFFFKKI